MTLPDIDPNSLEWLLLLKIVVLWLVLLFILVLLLLSIGMLLLLCSIDVRCVKADFSSTSWSSLQYNEPPSRNANSSP